MDLLLNHIEFVFDQEKEQKLIRERNISFKEIIKAIASGALIDVINNPSSKYMYQKVYVIELRRFIYLVPFVMENNKVFLKTIYPSRKAVKKYLNRKWI